MPPSGPDEIYPSHSMLISEMDKFAHRVFDKSYVFESGHQYYDLFNPFVHINEMLKTTNIDLLLKELNKSLGANKTPIVIDKYAGFDEGQKCAQELKIPAKIFDYDKIEDICNKMMWSISSMFVKTKDGQEKYMNVQKEKGWTPVSRKDKGKRYEHYCMVVEPIQSEISTDYVNRECNSKVYHITERHIYDEEISKKGLRMKGEKNGYRFIKNKVYFFTGKDKDSLNKAFREVAQSKQAWDYSVETLKSPYCILEIDCSKYNIDFYRDTFYSSKDIIYTYAFFPPSMIKKLEMKDFTKYIK